MGKRLVPSSVYVRIRPLADTGGHAEDDDENGKVPMKRLLGWTDTSIRIQDRHGTKEYDFPKKVLPPDISQEEMYQEMLPSFVDRFTMSGGYNVLFFAYGQTGTGKTFTIFGPERSLEKEELHLQWGVFPRVVNNVFHTMQERAGTKYILTASAIEFYLGECHDLLAENNPIVIGSDFQPRGHTLQRLLSTRDLAPFLANVRENRTVRATKMNEMTEDCSGSSRSHCALILTLFQVDSSHQFTKTIFTLVDFAGAERPEKAGGERHSGVEVLMDILAGREVKTGAQAFVINWELFELGTAVLRAAEQHRQNKRYLPPRQCVSAFLQFVASCMDGSSLLGMLVTVSQAARNGWETWFTMKYGTDLSKLRAPCRPQKSVHIEKALTLLKRQVARAKEMLAKTPKEGAPSSKYYVQREIELKEFSNRLELLGMLN